MGRRAKKSLILLLILPALFRAPATLAADEMPFVRYSPLGPLVLLVSYPPGEWSRGLQRGLESKLRGLAIEVPVVPIVYHSEYWNRRHSYQRIEEHRRILKSMDRLRPRALVVSDDEAADLILQSMDRVQPPLFFTGINRTKDAFQEKLSGHPAAVVLEDYRFESAFLAMKRLVPDARRFASITSRNPSSNWVEGQLQDAVSGEGRVDSKVRVESVRVGTWEEWKASLKRLDSAVDFFWVLVPYDVRDGLGREVLPTEIGNWMRKHLRHPFLGLSTVHAKMGALISTGVRPEFLGEHSALQLARFFRGEPLTSIGFEKLFKSQLILHRKAWKKHSSRLPLDLISVCEWEEGFELADGR